MKRSFSEEFDSMCPNAGPTKKARFASALENNDSYEQFSDVECLFDDGVFSDLVNDDSSNLWIYDGEEPVDMCDWLSAETRSEVTPSISTMSSLKSEVALPSSNNTKKRITWSPTLEFPRYFNKDDYPLAASTDALHISEFASNYDDDDEDDFDQSYMSAVDDLILSVTREGL